jgi:hypothetical protein
MRSLRATIILTTTFILQAMLEGQPTIAIDPALMRELTGTYLIDERLVYIGPGGGLADYRRRR